MILTFLGDVHAKLYDMRIDRLSGTVIQVGDLGFGFRKIDNNTIIKPITHFIRGNHDKPEFAKLHPSYLGDFGYKPEWGAFYMGGAASVDIENRTEGLDWWRDEELSYAQSLEALDLYDRVRPEIVISHEAPADVPEVMKLIRSKRNTNTSYALREMFDIHKPKYWVFGHYHQNSKMSILGTQFVCVGELSTWQLEI
jgi:hypothetical protein